MKFFLKKKTLERVFYKVGAAGFEPATSWSQTRRDDRTTLRPEEFCLKVAESKGFEPLVQFPVRLFSKQVLSATQATLLSNIYKSICSVIASANIMEFLVVTKNIYLIFFVFLIPHYLKKKKYA